MSEQLLMFKRFHCTYYYCAIIVISTLYLCLFVIVYSCITKVNKTCVTEVIEGSYDAVIHQQP